MAAETDNDAFTTELFNYWIPRLAADGVDVNDVLAVRARVTGWDDWPTTWAEIGDDYRSLAAARLADGQSLSAGEARAGQPSLSLRPGGRLSRPRRESRLAGS